MILTADPVASHRYGLDLTRRHGLIVFVAQPPEIKFDFNDFVFRDLSVLMSRERYGVDDLQSVFQVLQ